MWRAGIVFGVMICSTVVWGQAQQNDSDKSSTTNPVTLAELIHQDFKDCLIDPPHPRPRLYAQETYEFAGNAGRLNTFLDQIAKLPSDPPTTVYLCGPGHPVVQPLNSAVAQAAVEYDWKVRTFAERISVYIPLASRIPFAEIKFPNELHIESEPAVQPITEDFLRLRELEIGTQDGPANPKE
jgi:hypothetical protein